MLPIWQAEFGLSYAAIGVLRGVFAGTMASLQIPAGLLAERLGAVMVLAGGTALAGLGYCLAGTSAGIGMLVVALLIGGLGSSTQHPIASALVARAFTGPQSFKALGTYNFAGDIGKMTIPAVAAFLLIALPWRPTLAILGAAGFVAAAAILLFTPRLADHKPAAKNSEHAEGKLPAAKHAFPILLTIGILDSATRMGFLTFLPFLLVAKGATLPLVGIALTLVFAGGAVGKLVCAFLGARIGATATMLVTESLTALLIIALLPLPLGWAVVMSADCRHRAERNFVRALRLRSGPGGARPACTRLWHLLYRHDWGGGDRAGDLRSRRRRTRLKWGADHRGRERVVDAAACAHFAPGAYGCSAPGLTPVAEHGLNERQRSDGRGIGAQDAGTKRKPHHTRSPQQRRSLLIRKAAFRTDKQCERRHNALACPNCRQGGDRIVQFSVLIAKYQYTLRRKLRQHLCQSNGWRNRGNGQHAALLRSLNRIGAHAIEIDSGRLSMARHDRLQMRNAKLDRLLHHVVKPGMLERCENVMQVARPRLGPRLFLRHKANATLARPLLGSPPIRRRGR